MGRSVSASAQAETRRDRGVRLDRVQITRRSRSGQRQGDEGPAYSEDDGSEEAILRREAHGLRRLYHDRRYVTAARSLVGRPRLQLGDLVVKLLGEARCLF